MGILIQDERRKDNNTTAPTTPATTTASTEGEAPHDGSLRKRKQGKTVGHPIDMLNHNRNSTNDVTTRRQSGGDQATSSTMERNNNKFHSQENMRAGGADGETVGNKTNMKRNGSISSLLPLKRAGELSTKLCQVISLRGRIQTILRLASQFLFFYKIGNARSCSRGGRYDTESMKELVFSYFLYFSCAVSIFSKLKILEASKLV